jgi:transglutaminase-like putative cysteine protease
MPAALQDTLRSRLPGLWNPVLPWLAAALTLAAAPHAVRMPFWIPIVYLALTAYRLARPAAGVTRHGTIASTAFKLLVGACIVGGVFASYGTLTGRDAGVALLVLLAAMKLVEMRRLRDQYVAIFIGLFLLLTNFFYAQSILMALYTVATVIVFIAALSSFNDERAVLAAPARLRLAGVLFAQSLPLMLVLFLLFPRVPGPLWGLPKDARGAQSGLDDQMTPGTISELSLSDAVAFRVEFEGDPPKRDQLYWRGPVLWFTDGVKWVQDRRRPRDVAAISVRGRPVRYTVTLEPTEKHWLFALEMPEEPPHSAFFTHDLQLRARAPLANRLRYSLVSHPEFTLGTTGYEELIRALQLPPGRHARAVELAAGWREEGLGDAALVERALSMFREQEFYYTLTPPLLLQDAVDQFLFETRQGFCEHYAASFVVLMRAAGVPARVVTGYQGGTLNPVGGYFIVRQRDAHAWAEVWLADAGWVRVDPTAAVAPSRIMQGIETALPDALIDIPAMLQNSAIARNLWERFGFTWDALNNRWNQWVLGYDRNRQSIVLRRLGLDWIDDEGLLFGLSVASAGVLLLVAWALLRDAGREPDEARRIYERFCRRLARRGLGRAPSEGPEHFARRAAQRFPQIAGSIADITRLYVAVRYAGEPHRLGELKRAVRNAGRINPALLQRNL